MRTSCRRQVIVLCVAIAAWLVVLAMLLHQPAPGDELRLAFFAVLVIAGGATTLAVLPWMLAGYIGQQLLFYVGGLMHGEVDRAKSEARPELTVVR